MHHIYILKKLVILVKGEGIFDKLCASEGMMFFLVEVLFKLKQIVVILLCCFLIFKRKQYYVKIQILSRSLPMIYEASAMQSG